MTAEDHYANKRITDKDIQNIVGGITDIEYHFIKIRLDQAALMDDFEMFRDLVCKFCELYQNSLLDRIITEYTRTSYLNPARVRSIYLAAIRDN